MKDINQKKENDRKGNIIQILTIRYMLSTFISGTVLKG